MKITSFLGVTAALLIGGVSAGISDATATTITINNINVAGEGFNDTTTVTPVAGNSGTTLGQQRLNVFQAAADYWETKLDSDVEIIVDAKMSALFCDSSGAVLASAGPETVSRNFPSAPVEDTLFPAALVNSLEGVDKEIGSADIGVTFNVNIDNNSECLSGMNWSYTIGVSESAGSIGLYSVVLHEIGHGLGFLTFVDEFGQREGGFNDHFMRFLHDKSTGKDWTAMDDGEREASSINTSNLVWTGQMAIDESVFLTNGLNSGKPQLYAPSIYNGGSSVSHWDTSLTPGELMEPFAENINEDWITIKAFYDMGWKGNPCLKTSLPNNKWIIFSLDCVPPSGENTIADLFADEISGDYDSVWVVFSLDSSTNSYKKMLIGDKLEIGKSYWVSQSTGGSVVLEVPRNSHRTPVVNSAICTSDQGCFEYVLSTESGLNDWNMIGNPFLETVALDELRVVTDGGVCASGCKLNEAKDASIVDDKLFLYNSSTTRYDPVGSGGTISARSGGWLQTLNAAHGKNPRILIPYK
ncbi:MAG: hypothetical protein L3J59_04415 [Methylococcaceae bacterium]|nr:hypothetical protein [Methylococcaceae bacterium]